MSTTITCKLCPSVIHDDDAMKALRLSDDHMATKHPGSDSLRNFPMQPRSHRRLQEIKRAGVALYNDPEIGRDKLTTKQVTDLAGCSIGTFYRYFPDRVALLDAIAPNRDNTPVETP